MAFMTEQSNRMRHYFLNFAEQEAEEGWICSLSWSQYLGLLYLSYSLFPTIWIAISIKKYSVHLASTPTFCPKLWYLKNWCFLLLQKHFVLSSCSNLPVSMTTPLHICVWHAVLEFVWERSEGDGRPGVLFLLSMVLVRFGKRELAIFYGKRIPKIFWVKNSKNWYNF